MSSNLSTPPSSTRPRIVRDISPAECLQRLDQLVLDVQGYGQVNVLAAWSALQCANTVADVMTAGSGYWRLTDSRGKPYPMSYTGQELVSQAETHLHRFNPKRLRVYVEGRVVVELDVVEFADTAGDVCAELRRLLQIPERVHLETHGARLAAHRPVVDFTSGPPADLHLIRGGHDE